MTYQPKAKEMAKFVAERLADEFGRRVVPNRAHQVKPDDHDFLCIFLGFENNQPTDFKSFKAGWLEPAALSLRNEVDLITEEQSFLSFGSPDVSWDNTAPFDSYNATVRNVSVHARLWRENDQLRSLIGIAALYNKKLNV